MTTVALIVAGGRGDRAGQGLPKQHRSIGGISVMRRAVQAFLGHSGIDGVHVVIHRDDASLYAEATLGLDLPAPVHGGNTRQQSVLAGLDAIAAAGKATRVLIHDAARPLVPAAMIDRVLAALDASDGAAPALAVVDSLRRGQAGEYTTLLVDAAIARDKLYRVQTPQGFNFAAIYAAHRAASPDATDDVAVALAAGLQIALVDGDEMAFKLTYVDDFARAERWLAAERGLAANHGQAVGMISRSASGFDIHRFGPGDHVWLCGVRVAHSHGLIGHSDADVGLHALTDALLGCIGAGDVGMHFPPSDPQWAGAASDQFLLHAAGLIAAGGGIIDHVDVTIIAERPKVGPIRAAMRERLGELLGLELDAVSVKATTTEGLGFTGRGEGIAAQAMATVRLPPAGAPVGSFDD